LDGSRDIPFVFQPLQRSVIKTTWTLKRRLVRDNDDNDGGDAATRKSDCVSEMREARTDFAMPSRRRDPRRSNWLPSPFFDPASRRRDFR